MVQDGTWARASMLDDAHRTAEERMLECVRRQVREFTPAVHRTRCAEVEQQLNLSPDLGKRQIALLRADSTEKKKDGFNSNHRQSRPVVSHGAPPGKHWSDVAPSFKSLSGAAG